MLNLLREWGLFNRGPELKVDLCCSGRGEIMRLISSARLLGGSIVVKQI
jgi:hypothetical protein